MCDIRKRPRCKFKKHPFVSLIYDLLGVFLQVLENVLHAKDVRSYTYFKFESIDDNDIYKDLDLVWNGYLSLK